MRLEEFIDAGAFKERIANEGKIVIRPSSIDQFIRCPAQWFRASVLGDYRKPNAAATAGTSLHKGVELGYTEKIEKGTIPPESVLTDIVVSEFKALVEKSEDIEYGEGETYQTFETDIVKGIKDYRANIMQECNPKGVETRYTIPIASPVVHCVSGSIDVDIQNSLADVKMMNKNKGVDNYLAQQSCYALLKEHNGEDVKIASIHKVIRGKTAEAVPLDVKKDFAKQWVNTMIDTLEEFNETENPRLFRGTSPQNCFLCSPKWCGYWDKCPFVKGLR